MDRKREPILRVGEKVKKDTLAYRGEVEKFLRGEISPIAFRVYRVPMGVYEQRAAGKYMVRIRIGAGLVLPYQLERIAQLSKTYGNKVVHVTTRQDNQIHDVDLEHTPDILENLLEVGLSPRGGGGNTVRNVTACPRAGVCPREEFDVAPYAVATAEYLLQFGSSYNLPRKYKIAFSGCADDCAFASVADLGFFAKRKGDVKGFSVYAAGGLGSNPAVAVKIEDFVADSEFLEVAEAVKRVFDKHGDRSNKHKARLRYVLARLGAQEFLRLYRSERQVLSKEGLEGDIPKPRDIACGFEPPCAEANAEDSWVPSGNVLPEKTQGRFTIRVALRLGDIPADDLVAVGRIAEEFGQGLVRTTQQQDLLITGVPRTNVDKVCAALKKLSVDVNGGESPKVVACAGAAATCKLGLCLSRGLAAAISEKLDKANVRSADTTIGISGCPNSCGHHHIAVLGFQGRAKRVNGKLMPCYDVLVGGRTVERDARLAEKIGTVPAKKIPEMLVELLTGGPVERGRLEQLVQEYGEFVSVSFPDDYYYGYGSDEPFSLAGRGPGECGVGVMDVIKVDINEAKETIKAAKNTSDDSKRSDCLYKAIVAATRALLIVFGLEPKNDREIFAAFSKHLIEPGWVKPQTEQLLNDVMDWQASNRSSTADLLPQAEELADRVEELFLSLDANLKFRVEPAVRKAEAAAGEAETEASKRVVDLRGVECPLNFVKAKLELEKVDIGQVLEVLLDEGEPVRNVPASFTQQGQEVVEVENKGDHFSVKIRRKK